MKTKQNMREIGKATQFKKGVAANPHGRPKAIVRITELARQYTEEAVETLREIMRDKKQSGQARVQAANSILNRGWGTPMQTIDVNLNANDVRKLTDVELLQLINQQRSELGDAGAGAIPTSPSSTKLN